MKTAIVTGLSLSKLSPSVAKIILSYCRLIEYNNFLKYNKT